MTTTLVPFDFEGQPVRVVTDEHGEPWFVASDIAQSLEYRMATRASVTGHVLDRLMTRFNMRSALSSLRWLHNNARKLRAAQLSPSLQASKALNYDASAVHWRHFNEWTIVVSEGAVMTAYFPRSDG